MKTIELVLGDWSDDGHGKTESFYIKTEEDIDDINSAYKKGSEIIGFWLDEEVCYEYENNVMEDDVFEKLEASGFPLLQEIIDNEMYLYEDVFTKIYLHVVSIGFKELFGRDFYFEYARKNIPTINIGGYGLFY